MDRLLSLHLGRPVAISDHDSDVLFPSARPSAPGFVAMTHLCRIIGRLLSAVNSIENAHKWRDQFDEKETQTRVEELSAELQSWKQNMLPEGGLRTTEQCVLLSSYYSAVQLLFRTFMPTPHWQSTIADLAMRECFDASTDCIRMSGEFIAKVPACHYYAFHGHNLFVSVMGLLHCIRQTNDRYILSEAEEQSLRGVTLLSQMEKEWPMATQYKAIAEEYEAFTQERVQQGNKGRCIFEDHIATLPEVREESTFDPWGEFAAQIELESNIFPSMPDAAWMSELFQLSPQPEAVPLEADVDPPPKRRRLENGRDSQPVCGFSLKRSNHGH